MENQLNDKMYFALAHLEIGRVVMKTDPDDAVKHFETAMKVNNISWENSIKVTKTVKMNLNYLELFIYFSLNFLQ